MISERFTDRIQVVMLERVDQSHDFPDGLYTFRRTMASAANLTSELLEAARLCHINAQGVGYINGKYIGTVIVDSKAPCLMLKTPRY